MTVKCYAVIAATALVLMGATGCTRAKAKTTPDAPALDVPPPPPRDVEVNESEPPPPMPLPQEPARNAPPRTTRNPAPASTQQPPRASDAPRTEPPKTEPTPVIEAAKPPEEPPKPPAPALQTTPAQADVEVERGIRATMTRAGNDLNRIDYRVLNTDGRTQYDAAKSFIRQAGDALSRKNLEYARTLADKAATIAAQLRGR